MRNAEFGMRNEIHASDLVGPSCRVPMRGTEIHTRPFDG